MGLLSCQLKDLIYIRLGGTMKQIYSNATVAWNEHEIELRESLIREIPLILKQTWMNLNPAVKFERVETPILTPESRLASHIEAKFDLIKTSRGYLRPETTAGTFEAFNQKFPMVPQMLKRLPFCMWQVGKSFRDEAKPDTMRSSKLRLVEFYQMEFQLFTSHGSKAPYLFAAVDALMRRFGGKCLEPDDLPHYSALTYDWEMDGLEVAGCSLRKDWPHGDVYEVAIGLDRLVAKILSK